MGLWCVIGVVVVVLSVVVGVFVGVWYEACFFCSF